MGRGRIYACPIVSTFGEAKLKYISIVTTRMSVHLLFPNNTYRYLLCGSLTTDFDTVLYDC